MVRGHVFRNKTTRTSIYLWTTERSGPINTMKRLRPECTAITHLFVLVSFTWVEDSRPGNLTRGVTSCGESDVKIESAQIIHTELEYKHMIIIRLIMKRFLVITLRHEAVLTRYSDRMKATSLLHLFQPFRTFESSSKTLIINLHVFFDIVHCFLESF